MLGKLDFSMRQLFGNCSFDEGGIDKKHIDSSVESCNIITFCQFFL